MLEPGCQTVLLSEKFLWDTGAVQKAKTEGEHAGQQKRKVLVVDDQHLIVDTIVEILEGSDFQAFAAYDGESALALAGRIRPDVLLADVLMPGMNGVELAIAVRRLLPSTEILLFTGQAGTSGILRQAESEGHGFQVVPKPIHPERLIEILKEKK